MTPMPLTPEQEADEYELRIEQMNANIAQMRANEEKLRNDIRIDGKKFAAQCVALGLAAAGVVVAAFAAGVHYGH